jgi:hypothetical protein
VRLALRIPNAVSNQVAVRFGDSDDQTHAVVSAVQAEGTCWGGWRGVARKGRDAVVCAELVDHAG